MLAGISLLAAFSLGQDVFNPNVTILSALIDTSNLSLSQTQYSVGYSHSGSDPDTYINNVLLTPGSSWDSDIDFFVNSSEFNYVDGTGSHVYTFGTAISGDVFWDINNVVSRSGPIMNVDAGIYDFTLDFIGGADSSASDTLASLSLQVEVFERLDLTVTGATSPDTIMAGQQSALSMTVRNDMATREFVATTWYVSGFFSGSNSLPFVGFDFSNNGWFDTHLAPGASRTNGHSFWTANAGTALGVYEGNNGVVGGLYNGDWHFAPMSPKPTITVIVPEPATMAVLGIGAMALVRRRRR